MGLSDLPEYILLEEAVHSYDIEPHLLYAAVADGTVRIVKVGERILVDTEDVAVISAQMANPCEEDELVSLNEAARRLNLGFGTVSRWQEHGWLPIVGNGPGRSKLVSWTQARALGKLREIHGRPRSRLIPRDKDFSRIPARRSTYS